MSVENAQVFCDRLATDAAFRTAYVKAEKGEARKQLLINAGYDFSHEEIELVMDHASFERSFSEDELKALTGGKAELQPLDIPLACAVVFTGL